MTSNTKIDNHIINASLKSEPTGRLIKRIHVPGLHLMISSLLGLSSRTQVKLLAKPCDSTIVLEALPSKTLT